jgi:hypothetical protein
VLACEWCDELGWEVCEACDSEARDDMLAYDVCDACELYEWCALSGGVEVAVVNGKRGRRVRVNIILGSARLCSPSSR